MTFATSIQALIGTNTCSLGSNLQCAVDWPRDRTFISGTPPSLGPATVARMGTLTGVQQTYALMSAFSDVIGPPPAPPIGIDNNGDIYFVYRYLYAGGIQQVSGTSLAQTGASFYSVPYQTQGSYANVIGPGSAQYMLDTGLGVIPAASVMVVSLGTVQQLLYPWPAGSVGSFVCPGKAGSYLGYLLNTPARSGGTQLLKLTEVDCSGVSVSASVVGTVVPTDVDAAWTSIGCNGICADGTDGNLLLCVFGQVGATQLNYLIKIDRTDASVIWTSALPVSGASSGIAGGGIMMTYSRVLHEKFCVLTASNAGSPPLTLTQIDTSDGSSTSFTTGLAGISPAAGVPQAFDDTSGALICNVQFIETIGSPIKRNSTPSNYSGWSMLYVIEAAPTPPVIGTRRFLAECGPIRVVQ